MVKSVTVGSYLIKILLISPIESIMRISKMLNKLFKYTLLNNWYLYIYNESKLGVTVVRLLVLNVP